MPQEAMLNMALGGATDWHTADPGSVKPGSGMGMYPSGHTLLCLDFSQAL